MSGSPFGILEARSSEHAADAQYNAATQAAQIQQQMFNQARADLAPYNVAGQNALAEMQKLQSGDVSSFYTSPGYEWTRDQGLQGIQRAASSTGRLGSGRYLKDATKYAEGLASQEFTNFYNRWQNMSQVGQAAAAGQATGALQSGNSLANTYMAGGAAQAAGILGQGNAYSNAMTNAGNQVGNYLMQSRPWASAVSPYAYGGGLGAVGSAGTVAGTGLTAAEMSSMMWL